MKLKLKDFNIEQIADSGECFRWNKIADNKYVGIIMGGVCIVEQNGEEVDIEKIKYELAVFTHGYTNPVKKIGSFKVSL